MAKAVKANLKMKIPAGRASAAPPVGSSLGQHGVNMMDFINSFNDATKDLNGQTLTVHITVFEDRTMSWRFVSLPTDAQHWASKKAPAAPTPRRSARSLPTQC